jgi:hypothetical protein
MKDMANHAKMAALEFAAMILKLIQAVLNLFGIPFQLVGRIIKGALSPAASGQQQEGSAQDQGQREEQVMSKGEPPPHPEIDAASDIKRAAGRIWRGESIEGAKLSKNMVAALMMLPKSDLKALSTARTKSLQEFATAVSVMKFEEPKVAANENTPPMPKVATKIASRKKVTEMNDAEFMELVENGRSD